MNVSVVIQLNQPFYDTRPLAAAGITHHLLSFDDGAPPPPALVARFFAIVDAATAPVAVHCRAGLGRTGTMAALYLNRSCGFTARQSIAWLRVVRPGSIIGEQLHYLCAVDDSMAALTAAAVAAAAAAPPGPFILAAHSLSTDGAAACGPAALKPLASRCSSRLRVQALSCPVAGQPCRRAIASGGPGPQPAQGGLLEPGPWQGLLQSSFEAAGARIRVGDGVAAQPPHHAQAVVVAARCGRPGPGAAAGLSAPKHREGRRRFQPEPEGQLRCRRAGGSEAGRRGRGCAASSRPARGPALAGLGLQVSGQWAR
jgi:hypothetical protein